MSADRALAAPMADGGHERLAAPGRCGDQRRRQRRRRPAPGLPSYGRRGRRWRGRAAFGRDVRVRAARSSSRDALARPVAPERRPRRASPPSARASASRAPADAARAAPGPSEATPAMRRRAASRRALPHARAIRAPGRQRPAAEDHAAALGRAIPDRADTAASRGSRPSRRSGARPAARRCRRRRRGRCRPGRRRCGPGRCGSRRRRSISSPMKVREAPVTPCTIEMLPASRFESWARKSVGRRSPIRRSFRNTPGLSALRDAGQDLPVDGVVALAAARRDDEVHAALQGRVVLRAAPRRARGPAA